MHQQIGQQAKEPSIQIMHIKNGTKLKIINKLIIFSCYRDLLFILINLFTVAFYK